MKQELDKQIDSLLRGTRAGGAGRARAAEHLTPDELSAYAENALPPGARAHYVAHIADCADCRRIITSIALAAQAAPGRDEPSAVTLAAGVAAAPTWRERLATLFAPRTLAYIAPVLAVALIGALALVVVRNRQDSGTSPTQVAQEQPAASDAKRPESIIAPQASPLAAADAPAGAGNSNSSVRVAQGSGAGAATGTAAGPGASTGDTRPAADALSPEAKEAESVMSKDASGHVGGLVDNAAPAPAKAAPPRSVVNEQAPVQTAAAPPPPAREAEQEDDEVAARQQRSVPKEADKREEGGQRQRNRAGTDETAANNMAGRNVSRRGAGGEAERARNNSRDETAELSAVKRKTDDQEERRAAPPAASNSSASRYAAGYEFRRRGGAWVDVSYRDSMSVSSYRRDSEGFRALVDDHPVIGRIAAELPGTFIFVVSGRAYRIY